MSKNKKKHNKRPFNPKAVDLHHLLWPASNWNSGYAKRLRLHPWLIIPIPRDTLHREIHSKIAEIPLPSGKSCKKVYEKLIEDLESGKITYNLNIESRLFWLVDAFNFNSEPLIIMALWYQIGIVRSFYKKPPNY